MCCPSQMMIPSLNWGLSGLAVFVVLYNLCMQIWTYRIVDEMSSSKYLTPWKRVLFEKTVFCPAIQEISCVC
jgi:hypothetical protein